MFIYIVVEYDIPGCGLLAGVKIALCKISQTGKLSTVNQHMTFSMKQECVHPKALKLVHGNVDSGQTVVVLIAQAVYNSFMASVKKVCLHISQCECIDEVKLFIHVHLIIILQFFNINLYLDILSLKKN